MSVAGLDHHWVLIERRRFTRYDTCVEYRQRPVDARSGRRGRATSTTYCTDDPTPPSPHRRLAVTPRGSLVERTNNGAPRSMELS